MLSGKAERSKAGEKVLQEKNRMRRRPTRGKHTNANAQMPEAVHDELLHRFERKVEFCFGSFGIVPPVDVEHALPRVDLPHLASDEIEEIVNHADLICGRYRRASRELFQKAAGRSRGFSVSKR